MGYAVRQDSGKNAGFLDIRVPFLRGHHADTAHCAVLGLRKNAGDDRQYEFVYGNISNSHNAVLDILTSILSPMQVMFCRSVFTQMERLMRKMYSLSTLRSEINSTMRGSELIKMEWPQSRNAYPLKRLGIRYSRLLMHSLIYALQSARLALVLGFICVSSGLTAEATSPVTTPIPSQADIDRVAAMLPGNPEGVGQPITNRQAWSIAAQEPAFQKQLKDAKVFATQPVPELTVALFNDVVTTGVRDTYETPFRLRSTRLVAFIIAECIENRGEYLPLIEREIGAILAERSWAAPTHVLLSKPYGGIERSIDLATATRAWTLATADYWLGDKLKPETRAHIRSETKRRVFDFYEDAIKTGDPHWGWMIGGSNWNAVCNSGVVGTALALLPSARERALFILGSRNYLSYYLNSFPEDGYDEEGLGYWKYGFGSYLSQAEAVYEATQGKINMFEGSRIRQIALFPRHLEIIDGIFPAFGDSDVVRAKGLEQAASFALLTLINQRWNMGWTDLDPAMNDMWATHPLGDRLYSFGLFGFPLPVYSGNAAAGSPPARDEASADNLRFFFKDSSVLITRSNRPGAPRLGLAIKGGHDGVGHGHNDNGSYVVVCDGAGLLVDPGMEIYTSKTFTIHRFESMMMNSYGHDVPYVGNTLQQGGTSSLGKIISTRFTDERDTLVMDLITGYPVPGVRKITRTYVLDRTRPAVEITDEAEFDQPTTFGSALITIWNWKERGPGSFLIYNESSAVQATVTVDGGSIDNKVEPFIAFRLPPDLHPERLGVSVSTPLTHVVMHTLIVPVQMPKPRK